VTTGTAANLTTISLTAGDWDVTGAIDISVRQEPSLLIFFPGFPKPV
jgi:hypothetical protein